MSQWTVVVSPLFRPVVLIWLTVYGKMPVTFSPYRGAPLDTHGAGAAAMEVWVGHFYLPQPRRSKSFKLNQKGEPTSLKEYYEIVENPALYQDLFPQMLILFTKIRF